MLPCLEAKGRSLLEQMREVASPQVIAWPGLDSDSGVLSSTPCDFSTFITGLIIFLFGPSEDSWQREAKTMFGPCGSSCDCLRVFF